MARRSIWDSAVKSIPSGLRPVDWLLLAWSAGAVMILMSRWLESADPSLTLQIALHSAIIAGVLFMRWENQRTRYLSVKFVTDFSPLAFLLLDYFSLMPLIMAIGRPLADGWLSRADTYLFGTPPSLLLEPFIRPVFTEVLIIAYSSFYLWPFLLAVFVYFRGNQRNFEFVELVMLMSFLTNYVFYMLFPACGPRYYMFDAYTVPLRGIWLGDKLIDAFFQVPMIFDCFPSGHTAVSLLTVILAYRYHRLYFWCILPVTAGIIFATIYGRFHYVIDVLLAVPFALSILGLSHLIDRGYYTARQRLSAWRRYYEQA